MVWLIWVGCALAVLLAVSGMIFTRCFVRWPMPHERLDLPRKGVYERVWDQLVELVEEMEREHYEEARIRARDGVELYGRYYHFAHGAPVQIMMHGYRGSYQDLCGALKLAKAMGHNALIVHQRAHGRSGGRVITFGIRERFDCVDWARFVAQKYPDAPILLYGISMGAATVLMASELALPPQVAGVIADCPYSTPAAIIRKVSEQDLHLPSVLTMPLIRLSALVYGGFRLSEASPLVAVGSTDLPILLIHGEVDAFVPCDMSRELAKACASQVTLVTLPAADHGIAYMCDAPAYARVVREFADAVLPPKT